jgi:hypothetical protein
MKFSYYSLLLLLSLASLSAMDGDKAGASKEITGFAGFVDRAGTAYQHVAAPLAAVSMDPEHRLSTLVTAVALNEALIHAGNWVLGGSRTFSRIATHPEPESPTAETILQYLGRKSANCVIHVANQGEKMLTTIAPFVLFSIMFEKPRYPSYR